MKKPSWVVRGKEERIIKQVVEERMRILAEPRSCSERKEVHSGLGCTYCTETALNKAVIQVVAEARKGKLIPEAKEDTPRRVIEDSVCVALLNEVLTYFDGNLDQIVDIKTRIKKAIRG